jgi:AraC-like DNA-binding protein
MPIAHAVSLTRFLGGELVSALGGLEPARVLGPWRGRRPAERRRRARFVPVFYGEDHAHDHAELCLLLAGRCHFSFGHAGCVLEPGDLVVCPAGQPHAESWRRRGESYRLAWWNLHEGEPTLHVTHYARRGGFALVHQLSLAALPAEARGRLDTLRALAAAKTAPDVEAFREALLTLALALYRCARESGEAQLDTRALLVRRAAEFVRAEAHRPLALAEVARAVHVSPNYLTGLFRATTGAPLGRFVLEERIALAQRRLRVTGATVKTVALELGFADPFTFSRAFKRVTGKAPRVWQAQGR